MPDPGLVRTLNLLIATVVVLGAAAMFWNGLWVCDDAYITFRHVAQWLDGNGLTYNAGERVEGFSHPLWVLILAAVGLAGLDVPPSALLLNLAASIAVVALLVVAQPRGGGERLLIPFSAALVLGNSGFVDFATSGMEVALSNLLLALLALSLLRAPLVEHPVRVGLLVSAIYLNHPDLGIYVVAPLVLVVVSRRSFARPRPLVALALSLSGPALAYHLFRLLYYGEIWPNTYYAKAAGSAFWSQGFSYLTHFLKHSPLTWVGLAVLAILLVRDHRRGSGTERWRRTALAVAMLAHVTYVVRLGGDFMAFRLLVPDLVVLAVLVLGQRYDLPHPALARPAVRAAAAVLLVAVIGRQLVVDPRPPKLDGWIADERQHYATDDASGFEVLLEPPRHPWWEIGSGLRSLQDHLDGIDLKVAAPNIGFLGYAAGTRVAILDQVGLVDRAVARNWKVREGQPRGRPGHEDKLTPALAIELGVQIWNTPFRRYNAIMATPYGIIVSFDPALVRAYPEKFARLGELKRRLEHSVEPNDRRELGWIELLEDRASIELPR